MGTSEQGRFRWKIFGGGVVYSNVGIILVFFSGPSSLTNLLVHAAGAARVHPGRGVLDGSIAVYLKPLGFVVYSILFAVYSKQNFGSLFK